jgi:hypothetical protein
MGLLDDAIREHLDLKRRRGADPTEVERLEREALGPVKRAAYQPEEPGLDYDSEQESVVVEEAEPDWSEPAEGAPVFDQAPEYEPPPAPESQVVPQSEGATEMPRHHEFAEAWEEHESLQVSGEPPPGDRFAAEDSFAPEEPFGSDGPSVSEEPFVAEESLAPEEPDRTQVLPPPDDLGQETAEYDVEAEHAGEHEDVLEETPEFLQDTPDHDRLWFEQRPPKDFDLDG